MKERFILLSVIVLSAVIGGYAQTVASTTKRTITAPGLKEMVTVRKDFRSIPYIEAKNDDDLYFAQGYVTASDRLWQMDLFRRVARGETAEIFGQVSLEEDKRFRKFGFSQLAKESFTGLNPQYRAILESYARGVNAYIASLDEKSLPVEFQLLKYKPAPWAPTDSLVIGAILADGLSTTWFADIARAAFAGLPKEKYEQLFIERTPYDVLVVGKDLDEGKLQREKGKSVGTLVSENTFQWANEEERVRRSSLERIGFYQEFNAASNNWVVSGKRTLDGKPILGNDPHLPASSPSIWYLSSLFAPQMRVSGVTFPGVPGVVLGHNEHIAWGATNLGPDVQDLYVETFNEEGQYKTPKGWEEARVRTEMIMVRKSLAGTETEPVALKVVETRNGVIITAQAGKQFALKWTARDPKSDSFEAFLLLNRAKNWKEFKSALKTYGGATQNFVYADVEGNIGFHNGGIIPIRRKGDGSVPYDGATNDGDWVGSIPFDELPQSYNPPEGFIVTANQRLAGDNYDHFLTHLWADPYRARRIFGLLSANKKLTVNDVKDIQRDTFSISFSSFAREMAAMGAGSTDTLSLVNGWDGRMSADSKAAALVSKIRLAFLKKVLEAGVGKELAGRYRWGMENSFIDWLIREKPPSWLPREFAGYKELLIACDKEARGNAANEALPAYGDGVKINFRHPLAAAPLIGALFAIPPIPQSGNGLTPNVGANVSMRNIAVPGNWDESRQGIGLGQSGDPKSPFFKDQTNDWLAGNTPVFPFSKEAVEKAAREVMILRP